MWGLVALWLLCQGTAWWGVIVVAWGLLLVSSIDNFLRPYLLGKISDLPMVLGFLGFIGGIPAFALSACFSAQRCWRLVTISSLNGAQPSLRSADIPRKPPQSVPWALTSDNWIGHRLKASGGPSQLSIADCKIDIRYGR